jgi:hypothetical protein
VQRRSLHDLRHHSAALSGLGIEWFALCVGEAECISQQCLSLLQSSDLIVRIMSFVFMNPSMFSSCRDPGPVQFLNAGRIGTHNDELRSEVLLISGRQVLRARPRDLPSSGREPGATSLLVCGRSAFPRHGSSRPIRLCAWSP